jgi:hypothetical protein
MPAAINATGVLAYLINVLPTIVVQLVIGPGYKPITKIAIIETIITSFKEADTFIFVASAASFMTITLMAEK